MSTPFDQSAYQVRFEWGAEGLARLAPADVVVVVDVLRFSSALVDAVVESPVSLEEARRGSADGAAVADAASDTLLLVGGLRNATAVAEAILGVQEERQRRTSVAIVAAGESAPEGGLRFAVEDQLGAGAIISALSDRGIDHSSPEAAVAAESFRGLRQAVRHLLSGSGSGRGIAQGGAAGAAAEEGAFAASVTVREAAALDDSTVVPTLRDGVFVPLG